MSISSDLPFTEQIAFLWHWLLTDPLEVTAMFLGGVLLGALIAFILTR
jgi:hypothetical protein